MRPPSLHNLFTTHNTKTVISIPAWAQQMADGDSIGGNPQSAYTRAPQLYRAVQMRANSLSAVPFAIHDTRGNIAEWPFPQHLSRLLYEMEASMCISGAGFALKLEPATGGSRVVGLQVLAPDTVRVKMLNNHLSFEQQLRGRIYGPWDSKRMLYIREFSFTDEIGHGLAPARVALSASNLRISMQEFATGFFASGAQPLTLLTMSGNPPPMEVERTERFFKRKMTGIVNAWRVLALKTDVTVQPITPHINTMAMPELQETTTREIAAAFGIPLSLLTSDSANYATAQSDTRLYYENTIKPRLTLYEDAINRQLLDDLNLALHFTPEMLPVYQEDEAERSGSLLNLVNAGMPLADAMSTLGYVMQDVAGLSTADGAEGGGAAGAVAPASDGDAIGTVTRIGGIDAERAVTMCNLVSTGEADPIVVRIALTSMGFTEQQASAMVDAAARFSVRVAEAPPSKALALSAYQEAAHVDNMQQEVKAWAKVASRDRARAGHFICEHIVPELEDWCKLKLSNKDLDATAIFEHLFVKELRYRTQAEKAVAGKITSVFKKYAAPLEKAALTGKVPIQTLDAMAAELATKLTPVIKNVFVTQLRADASSFGEPVTPSTYTTTAQDWANNHTIELSQRVTATTSKDLHKAIEEMVRSPNMPIGQINRAVRARLYKTFSPYRVAMITTTEVTRAKAGATNQYTTILEDAGLKVNTRWVTRIDERVCYICGPLDDTMADVWQTQHSDGPPAHPNCRCRIYVEKKR